MLHTCMLHATCYMLQATSYMLHTCMLHATCYMLHATSYMLHTCMLHASCYMLLASHVHATCFTCACYMLHATCYMLHASHVHATCYIQSGVWRIHASHMHHHTAVVGLHTQESGSCTAHECQIRRLNADGYAVCLLCNKCFVRGPCLGMRSYGNTALFQFQAVCLAYKHMPYSNFRLSA